MNRLLSILALVLVTLALGIGALVLATFKSASDPAFWSVLCYCIIMGVTLVWCVDKALPEKGVTNMG